MHFSVKYQYQERKSIKIPELLLKENIQPWNEQYDIFHHTHDEEVLVIYQVASLLTIISL